MQAALRLHHFVSKAAFDIDGLGLKHIEFFYREGLVKSIVDLFNLEVRDKERLTSFRNSEGWGHKSADNLFQSINARRQISLDRFIYSLGILQIGQGIAKELAKHYVSYTGWRSSMEAALKDQTGEAYYDLLSIDGIGEVVAADLLAFMGEPNNQKVLDDLAGNNNRVGVVSVTDVKLLNSIDSEIAGKLFVFTGTLNNMTRQEAKVRVEALGGKVSSSISTKTDYIVSGANPGSKSKNAKELGVKIIPEEEWLHLISK
jgi:DNA ligase (NAD+)